mmetsp:Transcript_9968/g.25721  ORF Transcript_9968/g.25721 Transcript_9968/m.25721 type:complete len:231 (-) Transcript_9968:3140-3832(-)
MLSTSSPRAMWRCMGMEASSNAMAPVRARRFGLRKPPSKRAYSKVWRRFVTVKLKEPNPALLAIHLPSLKSAPHGTHLAGAVVVRGMAHSEWPRVGGTPRALRSDPAGVNSPTQQLFGTLMRHSVLMAPPSSGSVSHTSSMCCSSPTSSVNAAAASSDRCQLTSTLSPFDTDDAEASIHESRRPPSDEGLELAPPTSKIGITKRAAIPLLSRRPVCKQKEVHRRARACGG